MSETTTEPIETDESVIPPAPAGPTTPNGPAQPPGFGFPTSLRDLAYVLFKWKWEMLLIVVLAVVGAATYLWLIRDTLYATEAKLLVKLGQEQAPPTTMLEDQPMLIAQRPQDVTSEVDILTSTDLLAQVVDELNLDAPAEPDPVPEALFARITYYAKAWKDRAKDLYKEALIAIGAKSRLTPREEAIEVLQHALDVKTLPNSNVLVATLYTPQREGAGRILNAIIDRYLEFRTDVFAGDRSVDYFQSQVEGSRARLHTAEATLSEFMRTHDIQQLEEQEGLLLNKLEDTRQRLKQAEIDHRIASMKVAQLRNIGTDSNADFSVLGEFPENSFPERLMLDLASLTREIESLQQVSTTSSQLENLNRQRLVVIEMLRNYVTALEKERAEQRNTLQALYDDMYAKLTHINEVETEWNEKQRAVTVAEDSYFFYQDKLEESQAIAALRQEKIGNVAVVQQAMDPLQPHGIGKPKLFLIGLIFAVFAALAWAALREYFDHGVYTADDLRNRLGRPVIAVVPAWRN